MESKQKTNDINEYNDLFDELSIEWYLITDLNEHLSEKNYIPNIFIHGAHKRP